jgi:hypothetical protein
MSSVVEIKPKKKRRRTVRPDYKEEKLISVFLRLPESLYRKIEANALANYRAVTQEIHMRLVRDDAAHPGRPADADR